MFLFVIYLFIFTFIRRLELKSQHVALSHSHMLVPGPYQTSPNQYGFRCRVWCYIGTSETLMIVEVWQHHTDSHSHIKCLTNQEASTTAPPGLAKAINRSTNSLGDVYLIHAGTTMSINIFFAPNYCSWICAASTSCLPYITWAFMQNTIQGYQWSSWHHPNATRQPIPSLKINKEKDTMDMLTCHTIFPIWISYHFML